MPNYEAQSGAASGAAIGTSINPGLGTAIGAGAGAILGSAFGGSRTPEGTNYNMTRELKQRRKFAEQNQGFDTWNLQNIYGKQIQTKVADAKAAGLHPLFAMGSPGYTPPASQAGGSPSAVPGQSQTGSHAMDAMKMMLAYIMQDKKLDQQKTIADKTAQLATLRLAQTNSGNQKFSAGVDEVLVKPREVVSRDKKDSSQSAGSEPGWRKVEIFPGIFAYAPASDEGWAEGLEGLVPQLATLAKNAGELSMFLGREGFRIHKQQVQKLFKMFSRKAKTSKVTPPPNFGPSP